MKTWWVVIERDLTWQPPLDSDGLPWMPLMYGPYETKDEANDAMENDFGVDALCQENCLDCYTQQVEVQAPWPS